MQIMTYEQTRLLNLARDQLNNITDDNIESIALVTEATSQLVRILELYLTARGIDPKGA